MVKMTDLARFLVSCWYLGGDGRGIPTSPQGVLDAAIKRVHDSGEFPDWVQNSLRFVESNVGLECVELDRILGWAERMGATRAVDPYNRTVQVKVGDRVIRSYLRDIELDEAEARRIGELLRDAVAKTEFLAF